MQTVPGKLVPKLARQLDANGLLPSSDRIKSEVSSRENCSKDRVSEIRMLFFVGKDLLRWIAHCMDFVERHPQLRKCAIKEQLSPAHLIQNAPAEVAAKLRKVGVVDYRSIFGRALGLNALFADIPPRELLTDDFIRNYYRFADQMFQSKQGSVTYSEIKDCGFEYEIYASGESTASTESTVTAIRAWAARSHTRVHLLSPHTG